MALSIRHAPNDPIRRDRPADATRAERLRTPMDAASAAVLPDWFGAEMDRLDPFEPRPHLAIAVSGGADSMALALLAQYWACRRGGAVIALTVDHGLRPGSGTEAELTLSRLAGRGIPGRKLIVPDLLRGPALAERARDARYEVLIDACTALGIIHLLVAHHRGDQVETVMMRALSSSAPRGLAGMAALSEARFVRILRPLLDIPPGNLRGFLTHRGMDWIEDPSNRDRSALRARLRGARADLDGTGKATEAVAEAARQAGVHRAARDRAVALTLAERATIGPEGYAVVTPGAIDPEALAALIRTIAGAPHAPPIDRAAVMARDLGKATLGGVMILPAGRRGPGWLLVRERRAMQGPVAACLNAVWDGRFRLTGALPDGFAPGLVVRALSSEAARFRTRGGLPASVLHGLPALWLGEKLIAIPHIGFGDSRWRFTFDPRNRASGAPFSFGSPFSSG